MTANDERKDVVFFQVTEKHKELLRALEGELFRNRGRGFQSLRFSGARKGIGSSTVFERNHYVESHYYE